MKKLVIAIVAALAVPASSHAADYVGLTVNKTKVAPGWTLAGTHTSGAFYRGDEIFSLALRRSFLGGRGEEQHWLTRHSRQPLLSFDGRSGRWQTKGLIGSVAVIDMTITATGPPQPAEFSWGCTGAFLRAPVRLDGSLTLRTGTRFFKTIRRSTLTGFVTYEDGAVSCDHPAPLTCDTSSFLYAGTPQASAIVGKRTFSLQFGDTAGAARWYHVMTVLDYDGLTGTLPTIDVRAPTTAIRGSARFTGADTTETSYGACRTTRTNGAATGSFRTTFTGWGARTLRLQPGMTASFSVTN